MDVISLAELVEFVVAVPGQHNLTGSLEDFARLLREESLSSLDSACPGAFAFLVFHPAADGPVGDYVRRGTLASDTGPRVLAFFTLDPDAVASPPFPYVPGVRVNTEVHVAYEVTRALFAPHTPPALPGVVLVGQLSGTHDAIYVPLGDLPDEDGVRSRLRSVFTLAGQALEGPAGREGFADRTAKALLAQGVPCRRSGRRSIGEWLAGAYHLLARHGLELMTVLGGTLAGRN
ncbi:hypothetical protein JK359_18485 [Streptomyces actinomycinicus]|uniref:Uncharacterized protein n=1 Tax=Streptomyces actinomycinicus TaxID=1695166 RepID=A0A937EIW3_9ACTN|nr:hypothetical protein [Streptomyces actinomycinicus]MBL1083932.1 hypothetical protein [Streptomyces actinomycinicus]